MKTKDEVIEDFMERNCAMSSKKGYNTIRSQLGGIWRNGYIAGFRDAEQDVNVAKNLCYDDGYKKGKEEAYQELSGWTPRECKDMINEAYQKGYEAGAKKPVMEELFKVAADKKKAIEDEAYARGLSDGSCIKGEELERIKANAYDDGYKKCLSEHDFDSPCTSCTEREEGYKQGLLDGTGTAIEEEYQRGLKDGWETARKMVCMNQSECLECFGDGNGQGSSYYYLDGIYKIEPQEAIDKIKAWEDKQPKPMTNAEKFKEVFGNTIRCDKNLDKDERGFVINPIEGETWYCKTAQWLDMPYEEPKTEEKLKEMEKE